MWLGCRCYAPAAPVAPPPPARFALTRTHLLPYNSQLSLGRRGLRGYIGSLVSALSCAEACPPARERERERERGWCTRSQPASSFRLSLLHSPAQLTSSHHSQSSNWNGDYGYKQLSPTTSVNAPIIGSRAIAMPGYPQFTTASGAFPVAPARPVPPTFFPGLYGTFTSPIQSAINRAAAGRKRQ